MKDISDILIADWTKSMKDYYNSHPEEQTSPIWMYKYMLKNTKFFSTGSLNDLRENYDIISSVKPIPMHKLWGNFIWNVSKNKKLFDDNYGGGDGDDEDSDNSRDRFRPKINSEKLTKEEYRMWSDSGNGSNLYFKSGYLYIKDVILEDFTTKKGECCEVWKFYLQDKTHDRFPAIAAFEAEDKEGLGESLHKVIASSPSTRFRVYGSGFHNCYHGRRTNYDRGQTFSVDHIMVDDDEDCDELIIPYNLVPKSNIYVKV